MGTVDAYNRLAAVWAETTDDNLWNELLERRMVRSLLPADLTGARILDAGCAAGTHAAWLAGQGGQVTGIDISPAMIDAATLRPSRRLTPPPLRARGRPPRAGAG
jgi:2-polyprenyl-3-methyl-5-hydroxy-6-metoxy-1,4-benzoquinol methylase